MIFNASLDRRNNVIPFVVPATGAKGGHRDPESPHDPIDEVWPEGARRVSRRSVQAMALLSHAVDHLSARMGGPRCFLVFARSDPRIQAVRLLMMLKLEIYFSSPPDEPWIYRVWRSLWEHRRNGNLAMNDSHH